MSLSLSRAALTYTRTLARTHNHAALTSNINECTKYLNWHDISNTQYLYLYSYHVSHTNTQRSPQRSLRPRGRQATSATRTCSISCARPPTSAAPYGSPVPTPPPTPSTYTPCFTHLSPEHTTLEFTLQLSDVYAPDPPFAPAPRTVHTTLHSHHGTKYLLGKNATRHASRQSRSVEAWGTIGLPPKAQAASFRVLHPTL